MNNAEMLSLELINIKDCIDKVGFLTELSNEELKSIYEFYRGERGCVLYFDKETRDCILYQIAYRFCDLIN